MKQIQDAYIVAATRTPIGRSHKGSFKHLRPDDLLALALRSALAQVPGLDPKAIEDVICGCAIPEAQQGLNVVVRKCVARKNTHGNGNTANAWRGAGVKFLNTLVAVHAEMTMPVLGTHQQEGYQQRHASRHE